MASAWLGNKIITETFGKPEVSSFSGGNIMNKYYLWENDVPYFNEEFEQEKPNLTPFIVDGGTDENGNKKKNGCVIVCPGGAYHIRADHEGDPICEFFNQYGISGFTLAYRLYPYDLNAIMGDVKRAVRWVRYHADEFGIDPEKIAVLGFSAGGNLATLGATQYDYGTDGDEIDRVSSRPNAGLLCYAVSSLTDELTHEGSREVLLRHFDEETKKELAVKLSGEHSVKEDTPPIFMWHTAGDGCVKVENPLTMAAALSAKKIPFELHVFPDGDHGLGLAGDVPGTREWAPLAADWLKRLGF